MICGGRILKMEHRKAVVNSFVQVFTMCVGGTGSFSAGVVGYMDPWINGPLGPPILGWMDPQSFCPRTDGPPVSICSRMDGLPPG